MSIVKKFKDLMGIEEIDDDEFEDHLIFRLFIYFDFIKFKLFLN